MNNTPMKSSLAAKAERLLRKAWLLVFSFVVAGGASAVTCIPNKTASMPDFLYAVHGDGTATDVLSGLQWKVCAEGQTWSAGACMGQVTEHSWDTAQSLAKTATYAGYKDWRLPSKDELLSLVEDCRVSPSINNIVFPSTPTAFFWTGSPLAGNLGLAWGVSFTTGGTDYYDRRVASQVRLVRGGQFFDSLTNDLCSLATGVGGTVTSVGTNPCAASHQIPTAKLKWEPQTQRINRRLNASVTMSKLSRLLHMQSMAAIQAETSIAPVTAQRPTRLEPPNLKLAKGEFETTAAFELRLLETRNHAEKEAEILYSIQLLKYEEELKQRATAEALAAEQAKSVVFAERKLKETWELLWPYLLGNPLLTDVIYNADQAVFEANLSAERGAFKQKITAPVPIADAPRVKLDLLSGKIAPEVSLLFPTMAVEWVLVENAAQRAKRFDDAKNSIPQLEALIAEFPSSKDAGDARSRIFTLAKTSKDLVNLIDKYPTWNEAKDARRRIPVLQKEAYQSAVQRGSSSAYQEFLDGFGGTDPANLRATAQKALATAIAREERERRESQERWERDRPRREASEAATRQCENTRQVCRSQCPPPAEGFKLDSSARNHCLFRCDDIKFN